MVLSYVRYTGSTGGGLTNNVEYLVLGWTVSGGFAYPVLLDDNNNANANANYNDVDVTKVTILGAEQVYP